MHLPGVTLEVGVTPKAETPGVRTHIPQVAETAKHIRVSYSYYRGVPPPITNGGVNEHGVAVRDVWSPSRPELIEMTPKDQSGPNYSDLARLVLERAKTAREGVELIGELIATYGYSTYGGNSHFIADQDEGWVVIECAGGKGLWAAERVGADDVRVSRPGYIGAMPADYLSHPDFMGPPHLIEFAIEQGWYDPGGGRPFHLNAAYGDRKYRWDGVIWIEEEMRKRAARPELIGLEDMMWAVRTPTLTGDTAGYGQVVPLKKYAHRQMRHLWHTQTGAVAAPFFPVYMGADSVPIEYGIHRYLTAGEGGRFVDSIRKPESVSLVSQGAESTRSAFRVFKRLFYLIMEDHALYLPEVTQLFETVEGDLIQAQAWVLETLQTLLDQTKEEAAAKFATYYVHNEGMKILEMAETLAASLELRTKVMRGISTTIDPNGSSRPDQTW
ncbi:MAG: C69 family dipeptidase [Chloroflexota bacterium]